MAKVVVTPLAQMKMRRDAARTLKEEAIRMRDNLRSDDPDPDLVEFVKIHDVDIDGVVMFYQSSQQKWEIEIGKLTGTPPHNVIELKTASLFGESDLQVGG